MTKRISSLTHGLPAHSVIGNPLAGDGPAQAVSHATLATALVTTGVVAPASGPAVLATVSDGYVLANTSGATAAPVGTSLTALLDHDLGNVQGAVPYRGTAWTELSPGTSGQFLQTQGAGANPLWATVNQLAVIPDSDLLANISGASALPVGTTLTAFLDHVLGTTQGAIIYRGSATWALLAPGVSGQFLETLGAGANPAWATPSARGMLPLVNGDTPPALIGDTHHQPIGVAL